MTARRRPSGMRYRKMVSNAIPEVRYRIVDSLGQGGMGEVCLADDLMLDRHVALKFLTAAGDRGSADRLLGEARAAAALDHPFICSIYEVTTVNDRLCIVMEFVRGETLERRLRRGPMPLMDGLRIAEEMAEALEAAHRRRVVHGDLKPANVMLTDDHHVKVMDFGLATRLPPGEEGNGHVSIAPSAATGTLTVRGTPAYMSPEQIHGDTADRRSDIFSFGVLVHELLSGENPFRRPSVDATLAAILSDPVAPLHERVRAIPASVSDVLARMLAREPTERYQSFSDVRRDLRRLAVGLSVPTPTAAPVVVERSSGDGTGGLIGRDAEHARLLQSLNLAASGRGSVLVLAGEAGIGKTRLAEEALAVARGRGWQTLVGRCYQQSGTPSLVPYIEMLEEASRVVPASVFRLAVGPSAPELAKLMPELHRLFPEMPAPLQLPAHLRQRFLFNNVREFLTRCSRAGPLVLVLDDFQWADESTVQLTEHLAQHVATEPIVLIVAYREKETTTPARGGTLRQLFDRARGQGQEALAPDAIRARVTQLVAQGHATVVAVRPFADTDVHAMLAALAHQDPPAAVVRRFLEQTGGNPFFIAELFRHLSEEGRLFDGRGRWRRELDFDTAAVPDSIRVLLERRVQHLSADTQRILRAAAVIGRDFELDLLEAVADVDSEALISALDEAERARLVKGPSGRLDVTWRFAHQLICQTLESGIPTLRRQRLHLRVADVMERLVSPSRVYTSDIAHHLYSAGRMADAAKTARALMTAADAAHQLYATEEAVQHYRRALEVVRDGARDDEMRLAIEERLGDLLALLGDAEGAMQRYQALSTTHDASRAPIDHARITRKLGALHWQAGDRTQAAACYQDALRTLGGGGTHIEAAHLYQELGLAAFRTGDNRQAVEWAERALQTAEAVLQNAVPAAADIRKSATAAIAHANNTIGVALARSGNLEAARERIERSVAAARECGLLDVACRAYANLGVLYSTVEPKRAIDVSLTGLELASKIGAPSLQSYIYANLAAAYCALTDRCETEGLRAAQTSADLDRYIGQLDHLAVPLIVMAQIFQCRGELRQARQLYDEALALAEKAADPQFLLPCYDGLATIYLDRDDTARAEQFMQKARELCDRTGLDPDTFLLLPFLS